MSTPALKCVLIMVIDPHESHRFPKIKQKKMHELIELTKTFGAQIVETAIQQRTTPHPATYIGGGKVEWLKKVVEEHHIDLVILGNVAKAGQIFRLEQTLWPINPKIQVLDRVSLILKIFELHANTLEAKLQIQLATIQHIGPRIYGLGGTVLSKQGAGAGSKGSGETNIEFERRKIKEQTQQIKKELAQLSKNHQQQLKKRRDQKVFTTALVGYTSAGKTTLFNALTGKERLTNQGLFTTLDTVVGKLKLDQFQEQILVSDTIGFIEDLPPELIKAFTTTLSLALEAELLLHVVDCADEFYREKIKTVEDILCDLKVDQQPLLIFNKYDLLDETQKHELQRQFSHREYLCISARTLQYLDTLKHIIQTKYFTFNSAS